MLIWYWTVAGPRRAWGEESVLIVTTRKSLINLAMWRNLLRGILLNRLCTRWVPLVCEQ
jgi:hypothetical protein